MVKLRRGTDGLETKPLDGGDHGKLAIVLGWLSEQIKAKTATTLDEYQATLECEHGINMRRSCLGGVLHRLVLLHKKTCEPKNRSGRSSAVGDDLNYRSPTLPAQLSGTAHIRR